MDPIKVNLNNLYFDPNNYRLQNNIKFEVIQEVNIKSEPVQNRVLESITGGKSKKNILIKELIESIKSNGFIRVDNILVRQLDGGGYLVVEGNRRLAALRVLKEEFVNGFDIGNLKKEIFDNPDNEKDPVNGIEVVVVKDSTEIFCSILMGLKHVSGNKKWHRFNQAKLLYDLYTNHRLSFDDIADKIGLESSSQVKNEIQSYATMLDYLDFVRKGEINDDNFDPFDKFMIFITVLSKPKLREWLQWDDQSLSFLNKENRERFYHWISPSEILDEDSLDEIKYIKKNPCIDNHKDIRILADKINDESFLNTMEETGSFTNALENDIIHTQKLFNSKMQNIYNSIKTITIDNINNMSSEDEVLFNKIKDSIDTLITIRNKK